MNTYGDWGFGPIPMKKNIELIIFNIKLIIFNYNLKNNFIYFKNNNISLLIYIFNYNHLVS